MQLEFVVLRSTLALPKFIYILHTVDPTNHCQLWEEYDGITKVGLERILAGAVTHRVWEMAKLKVNDGGLGLRAAQDHGLAAYAASKLGTQDLVGNILGQEREDHQLSKLMMEKFAEIFGSPREEITEQELEGYNPKAISVKVDERNAQPLLHENQE